MDEKVGHSKVKLSNDSKSLVELGSEPRDSSAKIRDSECCTNPV